MQKKVVSCLLLLLLLFVLHNYNEVFGFIPAKEVLLFLLKAGAFGGICFLIAWVFTKSVTRSGIITFFVLLFTLFFGPYHNAIQSALGERNMFSSYRVVVPFSLLVLGFIVYYLFKHAGRLEKFYRFLIVCLLVLNVTEVVRFGVHSLKYHSDHNLVYPGKPICNTYKSCNEPDSSKPDIYFLVFDAYTNNQSLQKLWHFDNSGITNWLSEKGFYIVHNGRANYNFTPYSVSSTFNMNYIDPFKSQRGDIPFYGYQAVQSISNNELTCMLQKEHYAIRFFTPFDNTFDTLEGYRMFSDIEMQLYNPTLPGKLYKDLSWKFPRLQQFISHITIEESFKQKREAIWRIIDSVKSTADSSVNRPPHFVYGHLMITHQPNLFDSSGGPIATKERNGLQFTFDTYVEQVQYANKVIKDVVQHILTKNKKKTVIIIEGDHGFRDFPHPMINYNFPNFNAIFFPEGSYTQLYDEMSPVNTFRIVLNHYFCQNLSLIKDSSIIVTYE